MAGYLVKATSKKGEDYDLLKNMYGQLMNQRSMELAHVLNLVGGSVKTNLFFGEADSRFAQVPAEQQKKAVAFLVANAFSTPKPLIIPDIIARLEANGAADRILNSQRGLLRQLVSEGRIKKMSEQVAAKPDGAYAPIDLMADLQKGIYGDLKADGIDLDLYKRNLIRAYTDTLVGEVNKDSATSDLPALARGQLLALLADLESAKAKNYPALTRLFLDDLRFRVNQALLPKTIIQGGGSSPNQGMIIFGGEMEAPTSF